MVQTGHPVPTTVHPSGQAKVSDGRSVVVTTPSGGVVAGLFYLVGGWFGAAFQTITAAQVTANPAITCALNIEQAEYQATAAQVVASPAFTPGGMVFWDGAASRLTPVATGNRLVGRAIAVASGNVPRFVLSEQPQLLLTRAAAMADLGGAPTQANFNDLLARLRTAGVIAT